MTLQLTVDTLHAVPEAQRALYVEKEGRFHLDIEGRENWPKEKTALEAELHATRASERGAIMERLAVALKNGGATPAGCDLFITISTNAFESRPSAANASSRSSRQTGLRPWPAAARTASRPSTIW